MEDQQLSTKTCLVVDDEADLREIICSELQYMGAKTFEAENITVAKSVMEHHHVDLIISDIRMPGGSGIDLLNFVKAKNNSIPPLILITGFADISCEEAFALGAEAIVSKPFQLEDLIQLAIKFTSPLEQRFYQIPYHSEEQVEVHFNETLSEKISSKEVAIGRGGVAIILELPQIEWTKGKEVTLLLRFRDKELKTVAICRWYRPVEHSSKFVVGLEFLALTEESVQILKPYWNQNKLVPFIPELI